MNVEEDEAGRLRAFRLRFGRGWDAEGRDADGGEGEDGEGEGREVEEESLLDLITGFGGGRGEEEMRGEVVGAGKGGKGGKGRGRR